MPKSAHCTAAVRAGLSSPARSPSQPPGTKVCKYACKGVSGWIRTSLASLTEATSWGPGRPPASCARGCILLERHPPLPCAAHAAIDQLWATAQAHPLVVQNSGLSCKAGITDQGPGFSPGSSADSCTKNAAMPARAWGFHAALSEQTHLLQRNAPVPLAFAVAARYGPLHPLADLGSNAQERGEQQQFSARNQESADICEKPEFSRIGMAIFDAQAP